MDLCATRFAERSNERDVGEGFRNLNEDQRTGFEIEQGAIGLQAHDCLI